MEESDSRLSLENMFAHKLSFYIYVLLFIKSSAGDQIAQFAF